MTKLPSHTSVLIIGAGPSGLMMAAQLLRNGIHPIIIDSKTQPNQESRALAVQARSLEIFRQLGIDESAVKQGNIAERLVMHQNVTEVASINLSSLGADVSPFPYVLILEQSKTERILIDYLTANACPIYWNCELISLEQSDGGATVEINREAEKQFITCDWLIGADGASSRVRKELGIAFSGGTYQHRFYLADLNIKQNLGEDAIRIFLKDEGFVGYFPMQQNSLRFIGVLPRTLANRSNISFQDIKPYLTYTLGFPVHDEQCNWFSVYQLHHRMAEMFHMQNCFLIGDAAHVHSPAGGQGMNTGLQDAYNLAWKLAGVLKGEYQRKILLTYSEERRPVAKRLLKTTDRIFTIGVSQNWLVRNLRNWLMPIVLPKLWNQDKVRSRIFSLISQTGISYSESSLSVHYSSKKRVKAGDRLPYIKFYDEKLNKETDLHSWCAKPGFTLLVIGKLNDRDLFLIAKWITETYPQNLNFYYLPPSEKNKHFFDFFEMDEKKKKALIIRPDMYIGYLSDAVVIEMIDTYLKETISWKK